MQAANQHEVPHVQPWHSYLHMGARSAAGAVRERASWPEMCKCESDSRTRRSRLPHSTHALHSFGTRRQNACLARFGFAGAPRNTPPPRATTACWQRQRPIESCPRPQTPARTENFEKTLGKPPAWRVCQSCSDIHERQHALRNPRNKAVLRFSDKEHYRSATDARFQFPQAIPHTPRYCKCHCIANMSVQDRNVGTASLVPNSKSHSGSATSVQWSRIAVQQY
jgi:hypothetical protein